jgi:hypothetical protein
VPAKGANRQKEGKLRHVDILHPTSCSKKK